MYRFDERTTDQIEAQDWTFPEDEIAGVNR
jgi:hypothetical protein